MTDLGVANGDDLLDVIDVAADAKVSLTGLLATVIQLGYQGDLERIAGITYLRRWAANAVIAHVASTRPAG